MFDQPNDQNNQQQDLSAPAPGGGQDDQQQNPAAPPANHDFNPKPAYDSVFDEQPQQVSDTGSLSGDDASTSAAPVDPQQSAAPASSSAPVQDDELLSIKQQALQELSPLVGQLEQDPEEKFHTTMRIIQASDNHSLVKEAYEAARQISDEKVRAQALLDIVNEINYFTKDGAKDDSEQSQHTQ